MIAFFIAAAVLAQPDRTCERPAYEYESRAIAADNFGHFAEVSRERERAAAVYLRCRATAPRPEREDALAGINLATAATYAWMVHDANRGCALMQRGITLTMSANASGRLRPNERRHTVVVIDEFRHDLRDGRTRWFGDKRRHPCAFDARYASRR